MARLIDELKKEHAALVSMLARAKDPNISHKETHKILLDAQASLLAHLKKEDAQLYPALNHAALGNVNLQRTVDLYSKDMEEISSNAMEFFRKYSSPDAPVDLEFAKAFGKLYATILRRQRSEESTLYREYEKLNL